MNTYSSLCATPSDINEHLPTLSEYASRCESVFETGVRGCVSSWAFVDGLLKNGSDTKKLFMNDIEVCDISNLLEYTKELPIDVTYEWKNNLQLDFTEKYDMTFIDTWHVYGQLKRELQKFAPLTNKYIAMHDTTVDAEHGECIRCNLDISSMAKVSGFDISEITKGLRPAVEEFLKENDEWEIDKVFTNNNGLTILKRRE
jgi:hypothetical protein